MKRIKMIFTLLTLLSLNVFGQTQNITFNQVYKLIEQKNFFKAKEIYNLKKNNLSTIDQNIAEVFLDNAFNRLEESNRKIKQLFYHKSILSDSLILKLYRVKEDNSIKLYQYKEAKNALESILTNYKELLSDKDVNEIENNLKIWIALENEPKQQVIIDEANRLKMETDKAGIKNLKISTSKDTVNFIFDTGANLSTVLEKTAKKFDMKILPVDIEVGTVTGQKIIAQLAVCPQMYLGTIKIRNAIFLVFKDDALYFPEIDYQINGILGYPIIEALREIQITQDGYFTVPKKETKIKYQPNMAMDGLTPLIYIEGKHFTFDTGADNTMLYESYYIENKEYIDKNYKPIKVGFAGAAGNKEFDGYIVTQSFNILDKKITLKDIQLLKEKRKNDETVYGNIGQDLIRQFDKMTLNFDHMFINFD